jgi:predicted HTH domain antitoxin
MRHPRAIKEDSGSKCERGALIDQQVRYFVLTCLSKWVEAMTDSLQITVELPRDLAQHADPAREAVEAVAIAGYRSGSLTAFQSRRLLGVQTRWEFEAFLKEREICDDSYTASDFQRDFESAMRVARMKKDG